MEPLGQAAVAGTTSTLMARWHLQMAERRPRPIMAVARLPSALVRHPIHTLVAHMVGAKRQTRMPSTRAAAHLLPDGLERAGKRLAGREEEARRPHLAPAATGAGAKLPRRAGEAMAQTAGKRLAGRAPQVARRPTHMRLLQAREVGPLHLPAVCTRIRARLE